MIIWLASYPRSGNTLLRTVLFQCFGINTYNMDCPDKPVDKTFELTHTSYITGAKRFDAPNWESFYPHASKSDSTFLIKTHNHPTDDQPAIYVVRDGRSSAMSYLAFHQELYPEAGRTLNEIISGDDMYGGWSEHYRAWVKRSKGPVLVLRFEQLVQGDPDMLGQIAEFIGHKGPIKPWQNPREELSQLAPWFFREGKTDWQPNSPWNKHYDNLFYAMHGDLMQELGFYNNEEIHLLKNNSSKHAYGELTGMIKSLIAKNSCLQKTCDERLNIISKINGNYDGEPGLLRKSWRLCFRTSRRSYLAGRFFMRRWFGPRIGVLNQYSPRTLCIPESYMSNSNAVHTPSISIVTASLNQGEFIERTIQSVLDQNYPDLEYIVHDGGSSDNTVDILQRYDTQLSGWHSQEDDGQTDALNKAFKKTSGEIMAYLNADDLLLPGALHYVADFFHRNPDVDAIYGNRIMIDEENRDIGKWIMPSHENDVLRWVDYIPQETLFWRRSIWDKAGGQLDNSFNFAMDWDLLLRFWESNAKFVRLPRYLGAVRVHPQQKTSSIMECQGRSDIERLHNRYHGRKISQYEIRKNTSRYLLKQVFHDRLLKTRDFFRRSIALK